MNYRSIKRLMYAQQVNMGGMLVRQAFPTQQVEQIDPFLLLHHARLKIEAGSRPLSLGVGPHPHRGFSPVTFIYEGDVHHRDSRGNSSVVSEGGTQWMHAGMGIVHSERPGQELADKGGYMEIIQLWVNVPQKHKLDQPTYMPLSKEDTPHWLSEDEKVKIGVVAGQFKDVQGKIPTLTPMNAWRVEMEEGSHQIFTVPTEHNLFFYLLRGSVTLKGFGLVEARNVVYFNNDYPEFAIEALEGAQLLVMSGEPIDQPLAMQGPFVMNTDTEIMVAMRDYQMGKMGILIEE